jgi:hypothetical protein
MYITQSGTGQHGFAFAHKSLIIQTWKLLTQINLPVFGALLDGENIYKPILAAKG